MDERRVPQIVFLDHISKLEMSGQLPDLRSWSVTAAGLLARPGTPEECRRSGESDEGSKNGKTMRLRAWRIRAARRMSA